MSNRRGHLVNRFKLQARYRLLAGFLLVAFGLVLVVSIPAMLMASIWVASWGWVVAAAASGAAAALMTTLGDDLLD